MHTSDHDFATPTVLATYEDLTEQLERSGTVAPELVELVRRFGDTLDRFARHRDLTLLRYRLLFEEAPDPYLITDPQGVIIEANAAARDLLHTAASLADTKLVSYITLSQRESFEGWLEQLHQGAPAARWDTAIDVPGEDAAMPVEISLADDLEGIGYRWLVRDQRERTAAERHLREVAESEHLAATELRSDSRAKTDFLVSLSHDLRGPVGALVHQAELLTTPNVPDSVRQRSQAALQENATLLAQMLDNLVEIERFALGELTVEKAPTSLAELVNDIVDPDDTDGGTVEVSLPAGEVTVSVDAAAIRRALRSLLRSVRQKTDGTISIVASDDNGHVRITISPTQSGPAGAAPPPENRIDLRLARTLIDLNGGKLQDGDGQGSDTTVSLPRAEDDGAAS